VIRALALALTVLVGCRREAPRPPAVQATLDVKDYLAREIGRAHV
jgi:hypothetical protein